MKMMKKALFVVLTVAIVACVLALSVAAETTTGTYGDLSYSITNGEVTITACNKNATVVEVPESIEGYPVTSIDSHLFYNCTLLEKIQWNAVEVSGCTYETFRNAGQNGSGIEFVFGDTVKVVPNHISGQESEGYNTDLKLKTVVIGKNVEVIGGESFGYLKTIENLYIVDLASWCNIEWYGYWPSGTPLGADVQNVYIEDRLTENIVIPDSVKEIKDNVFNGFDGLKSVTISENVEYVGDGAFSNCSNLNLINWNAKNAEISYRSPFLCSGKTDDGLNVVFGDSVESIPKGLFANYDAGTVNLKSVVFGKNIKSIGSNAFKMCEITSVILPDSVENIGMSAFFECKELQTVVLSENLKNIGSHAFVACSKLTDIVIPDSVTAIYDNTFWNCCSLETVTIGKSVASIGLSAFEGCLMLKNIVVPEATTYIAENAFNNTGLEKIIINNPKCVIEYNADTIPVDAVIYGHVNSPAQMYAQMYGRDFVPLSAGECEHTYSEWVIDADATCTQRGFAHRVCTLCNGYEFDVIDETGHIDDDADNICDVCDEVLSTQTPDTDDGGESGENNSSDGISSFFASIKELFNRIISWFRTIFGMV